MFYIYEIRDCHREEIRNASCFDTLECGNEQCLRMSKKSQKMTVISDAN